MGLVKGTLMFLLTSLLLISLTFGNLALTLSLSIGQDNFQNEFVKNIASVIAEETQGNEEFEFGLENAKQVCLNNTEFKVNVNGTDVSIPCERVQEGSQAVIEESIKDLVFEQESKSVKCDNPINCFIKYKDILFSEEAKNYFVSVFRKKETPTEASEIKLAGKNIIDTLIQSGLAKSKSDARRLIKQSGIRINNETVTSIEKTVQKGDLIQKGKRFFIKT